MGTITKAPADWEMRTVRIDEYNPSTGENQSVDILVPCYFVLGVQWCEIDSAYRVYLTNVGVGLAGFKKRADAFRFAVEFFRRLNKFLYRRGTVAEIANAMPNWALYWTVTCNGYKKYFDPEPFTAEYGCDPIKPI